MAARGRVSVGILILAVLTFALILPTSALAAPLLTDSYPVSNLSTFVVYGLSDGVRVGQSFTANAGGTLDSVKFAIDNEGKSDTGSLYAELWPITGTYGVDSVPSGVPLATSAPVDASTLPNDMIHAAPTTFTFANSVQLVQGAHYAIVVRYWPSNPTMIAASGLGYASTHPGNCFYQGSDGVWSPNPLPEDLIFYVYVNPTVLPVTNTSASSNWSLALLAVAGLGIAEVLRRRAQNAAWG